MIFDFVFILAIYVSISKAAEKLGHYNVEPGWVTISGISSGGAMAMQVHVAFSAHIHGAGIIAGIPYGCAENTSDDAINFCTLENSERINVEKLVGIITLQADLGKVDNPMNISGNNVYVFHGTKDVRVFPFSGKKISEIYEKLGAKLATKFDIEATHGYPTNFFGAACDLNSPPLFINNCNYHAAFEALDHLYNGTLKGLPLPTDQVVALEPIREFDQSEFGWNSKVSMDTTGFLYVPRGCQEVSRKCKLHIALHGCQQHRTWIGQIFVKYTGYLQVAEMNDIILLFPQAAPNNEQLLNPLGCWDWYGYINKDFLNQDGPQMVAIGRMLKRVVNIEDKSNNGCTFNCLVSLIFSLLLFPLFKCFSVV